MKLTLTPPIRRTLTLFGAIIAAILILGAAIHAFLETNGYLMIDKNASGADSYIDFSNGLGRLVYDAGDDEIEVINAGLHALETLDVAGVSTLVGIADGGRTNYDLKVGDTDTTPTYGMIQIGNTVLGRTSFKAGNIDLDGAILFQNIGGPVTSQIEFCFAESTGSSTRLALAKSGVGNATYNSRSMLLAGPAPANTDFVTVGYWQTNNSIFDNLACDTSGAGSDLGVQNDVEVEGDLFIDSILESTTAAGVTIESVLLKDGTLTVTSATTLNDTLQVIGAANIGGTLEVAGIQNTGNISTTGRNTTTTDNASSPAVRATNDGDNANRLALVVQGGEDAASGDNVLIEGQDGDGDVVFEIFHGTGPTAGIRVPSDRRRKSNITTSTLDGGHIVDRLHIREYDYEGNPGRGFIAQEVQELYPRAVGLMRNRSSALDTNPSSTLGLDTGQLILPLWEATQQTRRELKQLRKRVATLEKQVERLQNP